MLQLFLSYAHEDAKPAQQLAEELRRPGVEPWMDRALKLAGKWNDEIESRVAACDFFMPLLSKATQTGDETRFFRKEWQLASKAKRVFFSIYLEPCALPAPLSAEIAAEIKSRQYVELFPSYDDSLRRILRSLHDRKRTGVFEETFSCLGPDNTDWRLGGWQLDDADTTGGNSGSIHGLARLNPAQLLPQTVRQTAAIDIDVPGRSLMLRYRRRLRLAAPIAGAAGFRVAFDGELLDEVSHTDPPDDDWVTRSVPVPDRGGRRGRLEFTVSASSSMNLLATAEAWVDDLRIA